MTIAILDPLSISPAEECPHLYVFDEPAPVEVVKAPAESAADYLLKIPVAPIGDWAHPKYERVRFSQEDFNQMLSNWKQGAIGYEPPLFLGHPNDTNVTEGAPSLAFLYELKQEGDTLYSYYEPVEPDLFEPAPSGGLKVKGRGVYRYSSAEIVRNAQSKADGSDLGTLFVGMALTNRPFVPNLPFPEVVGRSTYSSSDSPVRVVFDTLPTSPDMTNGNTSAAPETPAEGTSITQLSALILQQTAQLKQLSDSLTQVTDQLTQANQRIAQLEGDAVTRTVSNLNLPAALRETFSGLLTDENLPAERKAELLSQLQTYSQQQTAEITTVQGDPAQSAESATTAADKPVNPYADIILKNQKLAEQRQAKAQTLV